MRGKRREASEKKKKRNCEMENVRNWAVAARRFHQYNQRRGRGRFGGVGWGCWGGCEGLSGLSSSGRVGEIDDISGQRDAGMINTVVDRLGLS